MLNVKEHRALIAGIVLVVAIGFLFLFPHKSGADTQPGPKNGNTVELSHNFEKWCDGPNLVYQSTGVAYGISSVSVLANSTECK